MLFIGGSGERAVGLAETSGVEEGRLRGGGGRFSWVHWKGGAFATELRLMEIPFGKGKGSWQTKTEMFFPGKALGAEMT